jgi:hypothetical protein
MNDAQQRHAALQAGDELAERAKRRAERQWSQQPSLAALAQDLRRQRARMLAQRAAWERGADVQRTQVWLYARIQKEAAQKTRQRFAGRLRIPWRFGWGWLAAPACLVALVWLWMSGRPPAPTPAHRVADSSLASPAALPPGTEPAQGGASVRSAQVPQPAVVASGSAKRGNASSPRGRQADSVPAVAPVAQTGSASMATDRTHLLTPQVLERIQNVAEQADGSLRVQVRTTNPSVRIYLIQQAETPAQMDEQPTPSAPSGGRE